jgi:hypothetical protein
LVALNYLSLKTLLTMPIKYYLQPNPITPDPNDQSARVLPNVVLDTDGIIKRMLLRGTTLTETDLKAAINLLNTVVSDEVADGNTVNLPFANIRPGISGVFANALDTFEPSRHTRKATLSQGLLLIQKMQNAKVEKITQPMAAPALMEYMDVNSGNANSKLTPGGIGQIVGEELKFNNANATEGIFFVDGSGAATKVQVIANRTDGKLVFSIPATLAVGNYSLEVRRAYTQSNTLRVGTLIDTLVVS